MVRLSAEFIASLPQKFQNKVKGPCTIYGSEFLDNIKPHPTNGTITKTLRPDAWRLLGVDAFIHNVDRRKNNENLGLRHGNFLAYDHDCALAFLHYLSTDESAIIDFCNPWITNHTFAKRFNGTPMPAEVGSDIGLIDDAWFETLMACTPAEWLTETAYSRIRSVLVSRALRFAEWLPKVEQCTI
jgi:hypothetical protein